MARPKATLMGHDNTELSVITKAENVLFSNGDTAQSLLDSGYDKMFTPTIESSKSMFKVGQGDNVDYSLNVVDGAYESCVIKGRTLVNNISVCNYKLTDTSAYKIPFSILMDTTKSYLLKFRINELPTWSDTSPTGRAIKIEWYDGSASGGYWSYGKDSITVGTNYYRIIKPYTGEVTSTSFTLWSNNLASGTLDIDVMIIEYQEGLENWDIPYFIGMCDVKSPILSNVGKNLVNPALFRFQDNLGGNGSEKVESVGDDIIFYGAAKGYYLDVILKENTSYYINYESRSDVTNIRLFDLDGWQINNLVPNTLTTDIQQNTIVTTNKKCRLRVWTEGSVAVIRKLMVAEVAQAIPYEPYKSNILTCETYFDEVSQSDKTIVLRSLPNGVCDTLNVETGEYVQRIGEYTFDGSHPMYGSINITGDKYFYTCTNVVTDNKRNLATNNQICDILPVKNPYEHTDENCAWLFYNQHSSYFRIALKEYCNENRESDVILWLKENPVTVQYELETPVVKTVNLSGFPYAYKDGHVILESGSIEQSLLPKVEYSLSTNRIGQIQTNQKMIEKHQKEIDELQKMILTNMVNSQYQQALTMLNYELSRV